MSLPEGFALKPSGSSRYLKFEQGKTKFRVLSDMIFGVVGWSGGKPVRAHKFNELPDAEFDQSPKEFLAMVVWDYQAAEKKRLAATEEDGLINPIKILEITQKSVLKELVNYEGNEDWGDCKNYDLTVTRNGEGKETRYSLIASPHKLLSPAISEAYKKEVINLSALFEGGNPFEVNTRIDPSELPF